MTLPDNTNDAPALRELAQQFDQQGFALKRSSHCGVALIASRDGDVRCLQSIAEAKRFLQSVDGGADA